MQKSFPFLSLREFVRANGPQSMKVALAMIQAVHAVGDHKTEQLFTSYWAALARYATASDK